MQANVIKLENENMKVLCIIKGYFEYLKSNHRDFEGEKTDRTQAEYEADIRQFYFLMRNKLKGKELEFLKLEELYISQDEFEAYIEKLCSLKDKNGKNKYVNKTINRKTSSLKNYLRYMKRKKFINQDVSYLELIEGKKERKNHYGVLEVDEVMEMIKLTSEERAYKEEKKALINLAFKTGLRISEILNLKHNCFITKGNEVFICGIGKGNKHFEIKINKNLHDELKQLNRGEEKLFKISSRSVTDMMDRLKTKMGIDDNRRIVFHSIRKCYGTVIWKLSDLETARRALRHENINTTQVYLGASEYDTNDIIFSIDSVGNETYKGASKEQLIAAIELLPNTAKLVFELKLKEVMSEIN